MKEQEFAAQLNDMNSKITRDLLSKTAEQLASELHFYWDDCLGADANLLIFCRALTLYEARCRQWEEHHNGRAGVAGRVAAKYLLPMTSAFIDRMMMKMVR